MENNDFMNQFEKIQALSRLMGGGDTGQAPAQPMDIMKTIETAKKLNAFMGLFQQNHQNTVTVESQPVNPEEQIPGAFLPPSKELNILNAAIPFLDKEYQKNIFLVVKLLEMGRAARMGELSIQSEGQERHGNGKKGLLKAIRPYLDNTERGHVDLLLKVMEMREIMNSNQEG